MTAGATRGAAEGRRVTTRVTSLRRAGYARDVLLVTAAGLVARFALLGRQPLWRDEAFTALVLRRPLGEMLEAVRSDSAPPLAYLLDRLVATVSTAPAALRLMPALAGTAAIPIGAALGRRVAGDRAGRWAALACAGSPALLLSARDARMYALTTTLVMAAALLLWRAIDRPGAVRWTLYGAAVSLALHSQYFAAFAVVAQLVAVALVLRPPRRTMITATSSAAVAAATLVPWLLVARAQLSHGSTPFWVQPLSPSTLGGVVLQFLSGPPIDEGVPAKTALQALQALAAGAGGMAAYALLRRWRDLSGPGRQAAGFLFLCGGGALLLFVLASAWHPLVEARYVSVAWGPLFPLVGVGLVLVRCRPLMAVAISAMMAAALAPALAPIHPDTPAIAAELRGRVGPHDLVSADPATYLLVLYYADPSTVDRTRVVAADVPWYWGTAAYPPGAIVPAIPADVLAHGGTVYSVFEVPTEEASRPPRGYRLTSRSCHVEVCVERYAPRTAARDQSSPTPSGSAAGP